MLRAKFVVTQIVRTHNFDGEQVTMQPVYSSDPASENHQFWKASPNGELRLGITNPVAVGKLELGREYYIDLTPAT